MPAHRPGPAGDRSPKSGLHCQSSASPSTSCKVTSGDAVFRKAVSNERPFPKPSQEFLHSLTGPASSASGFQSGPLIMEGAVSIDTGASHPPHLLLVPELCWHQPSSFASHNVLCNCTPLCQSSPRKCEENDMTTLLVGARCSPVPNSLELFPRYFLGPLFTQCQALCSIPGWPWTAEKVSEGINEMMHFCPVLIRQPATRQCWQ